MGVTPDDLAATMIARERVARAQRDVRAQQLRESVRLEIERARQNGLLSRAWLIGSLAWGGHGDNSDIDIVVDGVAPEQIDALWAQLCGPLGELLDLLRLEDLPPPFRERVLRDGVSLA